MVRSCLTVCLGEILCRFGVEKCIRLQRFDCEGRVTSMLVVGFQRRGNTPRLFQKSPITTE